MQTQAIVFDAPDQVSVRSIECRAVGAREVMLETLHSTVSPGTELRTLAGREKQAVQFPLVPGYSTVGRVVEIGDQVVGVEPGRLAVVRGGMALNDDVASSWGGHCRHVIVPEAELFLLPDGVDARHATLVVLLATTLHGVDLAQIRIREQVAVVGLGLVGQLSARLLRYAGANVVATDLLASRREVAKAAGIPVVEPGGSLRSAFDPHFPYGAEVVVDATGSSKVMAMSLTLLRERPREDPCGQPTGPDATRPLSAFEIMAKQTHLNNGWHGPRFIAQGSYADPIMIDYYDLFSQEVGFIVPRVHEIKELFRSIELLTDPRLSLDGLISRIVPYRDAPQVYEQLREKPDEQITVCFDW